MEPPHSVEPPPEDITNAPTKISGHYAGMGLTRKFAKTHVYPSLSKPLRNMVGVFDHSHLGDHRRGKPDVHRLCRPRFLGIQPIFQSTNHYVGGASNPSRRRRGFERLQFRTEHRTAGPDRWTAGDICVESFRASQQRVNCHQPAKGMTEQRLAACIHLRYGGYCWLHLIEDERQERIRTFIPDRGAPCPERILEIGNEAEIDGPVGCFFVIGVPDPDDDDGSVKNFLVPRGIGYR